MLVSVMLPVFLTVPLEVRMPPGLGGFAGQFCVTTRRGAVTSVQVADAVVETPIVVQASLPLAVTVLLTEHASPGAVKLAVKFADAPGVRLGTVRTVFGTDW